MGSLSKYIANKVSKKITDKIFGNPNLIAKWANYGVNIPLKCKVCGAVFITKNKKYIGFSTIYYGKDQKACSVCETDHRSSYLTPDYETYNKLCLEKTNKAKYTPKKIEINKEYLFEMLELIKNNKRIDEYGTRMFDYFDNYLEAKLTKSACLESISLFKDNLDGFIESLLELENTYAKDKYSSSILRALNFFKKSVISADLDVLENSKKLNDDKFLEKAKRYLEKALMYFEKGRFILVNITEKMHTLYD
jgi:hypothetical protein